MELEFKKRIILSEFESPFENFRTVKVTGEVRFCPLSGHPTRLLPVALEGIRPLGLDSDRRPIPGTGLPLLRRSPRNQDPPLPQKLWVGKGAHPGGGSHRVSQCFPLRRTLRGGGVHKRALSLPGPVHPGNAAGGVRRLAAYFVRRPPGSFPAPGRRSSTGITCPSPAPGSSTPICRPPFSRR